MGNYPWRRMNHKLANGMKMWKGNKNTTNLLFSLKGLKIVHQERRGQVKTIVMEHFNGILFLKSGPANKQHTNKQLPISCRDQVDRYGSLGGCKLQILIFINHQRGMKWKINSISGECGRPVWNQKKYWGGNTYSCLGRVFHQIHILGCQAEGQFYLQPSGFWYQGHTEVSCWLLYNLLPSETKKKNNN